MKTWSSGYTGTVNKRVSAEGIGSMGPHVFFFLIFSFLVLVCFYYMSSI